MFRFFIKPSSGSYSCLLKLLIVHYYFSKYAGSMSYFICDEFGFHVVRSPCVDFLSP